MERCYHTIKIHELYWQTHHDNHPERGVSLKKRAPRLEQRVSESEHKHRGWKVHIGGGKEIFWAGFQM